METEMASSKPFALRAIDLLRKKISVLLAGLVLLLLVPYLLKYLHNEKPALAMPAAENALSIKELIADLKNELGQLEDEREQRNEAAAFDILSFDLEISFMVRASSEQKSGVQYQVVTADTQIQQGIEKVQRLTLHMKPRGEEQLPTKRIEFPSDAELESATIIGTPPPKQGTNHEK